jgi:hypothetical protein
MTKVEIDNSGHDFLTLLYFETKPDEWVEMTVETGCPHLKGAVFDQTFKLDPMAELFKSEGSVLSQVAEKLPHRACPFLFSALKGLQVEARLDQPCVVNIKVGK